MSPADPAAASARLRDLQSAAPGAPPQRLDEESPAPVVKVRRETRAAAAPVRGAIIPRATYRVQLHQGFDFDAAVRLLPYLQRLGISHLYCSPIWRARPGSLHGYDVLDPTEINPELGGRDGFDRLCAAARERDIGLLLDIVPNHMGVIGGDNPWWREVLENGPASLHASTFDINWSPANPELQGRVLLPVLGKPYGEALDAGELQLAVDEPAGCFVCRYYEHVFPLDPRSWVALLQAGLELLDDPALRAEWESLTRELDMLPARGVAASSAAARRSDDLAACKQRLATLAASPPVRTALHAVVARWNDPAHRDELHALLEAQAYRLAFWRVASDEINYRRFFDINELAALRTEDERVFEAVHDAALAFTAAGIVDGLRIDHPDGLQDPAQYFVRLQQGHARRAGMAQARTRTRQWGLYVVAEKIAAAHEGIPREWALHGTTGYRFASVVNGLFVDRRRAAQFERVWRNFTGATEPFADVVHQAKLAVATTTLGAELAVLAQQLQAVALSNRRTRDHGLQTLHDAIAQVAACMPVYRTYVIDRPSEQDRRFIDWAVSQARHRSDIADPDVFEFVRQCLLMQAAPQSPPETLAMIRRFTLRFQQFCTPVAAKGVEDTAFYRYLRLVSLNEVGGDPDAFGVTVRAFHGASRDRSVRWPHTLLGTTTHDSKRSEDVRNRIDVLSEMPAAWRLGLRRWHGMTRSYRREVDGQPAPSRCDELLLYQTLIGTLPVGEFDDAQLADYRTRIEQYALKAAREAKVQTRWTLPNAGYEEALIGWVRGVLGRLSPNPVLADLRALADRVAHFGALNSLAMTVLKFTSPGVPDLYQGNEMIDLSLVDPDNRRPVDHDQRAQLLDALQALLDDPQRAAGLRAMVDLPTDGRLKLWATWRLLEQRRRHPQLFRDGDYLALSVTGVHREHVIAFARRHAGKVLVVVATRLLATRQSTIGRSGAGPLGWGDTAVDLSPLWAAGRRRAATSAPDAATAMPAPGAAAAMPAPGTTTAVPAKATTPAVPAKATTPAVPAVATTPAVPAVATTTAVPAVGRESEATVWSRGAGPIDAWDALTHAPVALSVAHLRLDDVLATLPAAALLIEGMSTSVAAAPPPAVAARTGAPVSGTR